MENHQQSRYALNVIGYWFLEFENTINTVILHHWKPIKNYGKIVLG